MKSPVSPLRRALYVSLPIAAAIVMVGACSSEQPDATMSSSGSPPGTPAGDRCGTPNEGCDCLEPGLQVDCGEVINKSADGFVQCSMGKRQCLGGKWGRCQGETDVTVKTSNLAGGRMVGTMALGDAAVCGAPGGGPANPCDPYCNAFVDDPVGLNPGGGLIVADGGLTIGQPEGGADGGAPASFQSTPTGVVTCGGAVNVSTGTTTCTAPGLAECQQDFRCDAISSTCVWNGGIGYYDPTAGGPDLTVGAPCGTSGSGAASAPVCNRGSVAVPAGSTITFHITPSLPSGCTNLGAASITNVLPSALAPGGCINLGLPNSTGNKFITVNAGAPGAVAEGPSRCLNNSAVFKDDGAPGCGACGTCDTKITGKVYDPSGAGAGTNNLPLAGISVFVPSGALTPFTDGVQCDSCASLETKATAGAVTDATGSFSMSNVTPGKNVPVVVQSGRWRRKITLPTVNACATTALPAGTLRMPKSRTDGDGSVADIPKIAISMGAVEALECLMLKIGLASTEVLPRTATTNQHRIQLFRDNGYRTSPTAANTSTLFSSTGPLNEFAAVLFGCHSFNGDTNTTNSQVWGTSAADRDRLRVYTDKGGRLFIDHWPGEALLRNGPAQYAATSTWTGSDDSKSPASGKVLLSTFPHTLFRDWLTNVGASTDYGAGFVRVDQARMQSVAPATGTEKWLRGESSNSPGNWTSDPNGDYSLSYSFDTPTAAGATCGTPGGRGRVFFNGMHVSAGRIAGGDTYTTNKNFPAGCDLSFGLTPEEKALEYQLFQLTACQLGGADPPAPPAPPPPLPVSYYSRDYYATCKVGERVKWGPLYWQGVFQPGTSIEFRAATADSVAALPGSPPAGTPTTAAVATANATVVTPAWDCNGCPGAPVSVDSQLVADTGTPSKAYLRLFMKFNPTTTIPPVLSSWRQIYDCVPAE